MSTGTGSGPGKRSGQKGSPPAFHPWYLVLLIPFIALLYPPFYATDQPELWGVPYFYWYQLLWLLITAVLTQIVYAATRGRSAS